MESTKTTEELLRENKNWSYIRTDRNNTRYFVDKTCPRCGGYGIIQCYGHVEGGKCFECGGSGICSGETIKVYTPEYAEKLRIRREARAQKEQERREAEAIAHRADKLKELGFSHDEATDEWFIYRVIGNTYPIKDFLKEKGFKFNPVVGWYAGAPIEEYPCQKLAQAQVLKESVFVEWKEKAEVTSIWEENLAPKEEDTSNWVGTIGSRLELNLTVKRVFSFDGIYGTSHTYIMRDDEGNAFKWVTTKILEENKTYHLRATVKDQIDYKGIKTTVITRATNVA